MEKQQKNMTLRRGP